MYAVVVLNDEEREITRFTSRTLAETFLKAVQDNLAELGATDTRLINVTHAVDIDPQKTKPKQHKRGRKPVMWCPYCGEWEIWSKDANGNLKCRMCGISDNEFYVKKYNHLWGEK